MTRFVSCSCDEFRRVKLRNIAAKWWGGQVRVEDGYPKLIWFDVRVGLAAWLSLWLNPKAMLASVRLFKHHYLPNDSARLHIVLRWRRCPSFKFDTEEHGRC